MMSSLVRRALRMIPPTTVVRVVDGPLRGYRWVAGAAPHGAWLGRLERPLLHDFASRIQPGDCVWDVGANVGLYTLAAARRVTPRGSVVAFEPIPSNAAALTRHLTLNALDWVRVERLAVTDHEGSARMMEHASESALNPAGSVDVRTITLDAWQARSGGPPPAVIKIDTEGAEALVLVGAAHVILDARPRIYLALHGETRAAECARLLREWQYNWTTVDGTPVAAAAEWIATPIAPD